MLWTSSPSFLYIKVFTPLLLDLGVPKRRIYDITNVLSGIG